MSTIPANDTGACGNLSPSVTLPTQLAYRVFLNLPETLHRQMIERSRAEGQDVNTLYQTALAVFARNLSCGVRLPIAAGETDGAGVFIQLPAERRRWVQRTASRLSLTESDIVAAAATWLLAGGDAPRPTLIVGPTTKPRSAHDPP